MNPNIPQTDRKRIVIIGGGFAGLTLARKLSKSGYQLILLDKNNYHQFQPLFYQVATSGLEASAISFPFRKIFQKNHNILIRVAEVEEISSSTHSVKTSIGDISYDYLVLAMGTTNNFFGNKNIETYSLPMKSISEALLLRNTILENMEKSVLAQDKDDKEGLQNLLIVGGGPTGTEIAGTLAEMKHYILPKDYPEMDFSQMKIILMEGLPSLLNGMSEASKKKAYEYLTEMGVEVKLNTMVKDFDGRRALLADGTEIRTDNLIWAAGVTGNSLKGINPDSLVKGNRLKTDKYLKVEGYTDVYAIGDIAFVQDDKFPKGHPQLAAVGIQQGGTLAANFKNLLRSKAPAQFEFKNKGTMATVGRNKAVVDLPFMSFHGFFAWLTWMFVHLILTLGAKNKVLILINWFWNYIVHDQSLRLIIRPTEKKEAYALKTELK